MALVRKCDICGSQLESTSVYQQLKIEELNSLNCLRGEKMIVKELCDACRKEIEKYMNRMTMIHSGVPVRFELPSLEDRETN